MKELLAKLEKLLDGTESYREIENPWFEDNDKDEKDSKLLGLIKDIPDELGALETTFDLWHEALKGEFLQFIENSKYLHESSIKEKDSLSEKLPPSADSEFIAQKGFLENIFQFHYYCKIIEFLHFIYILYPRDIEDDKKIKEYESYIDSVLKPLIHPTYEYYRKISLGTCKKLSDYPQFSLEKFSEVFNFYMDKFSEYFKKEKSNFQEFANQCESCGQLE